jgi:zeta-carotene isomerase
MRRSNLPLSKPIKASKSGYDNDGSTKEDQPIRESALVGEDAAVFDLSSQKISSWIYFTIVLGVVLTILNFIWIDPRTGYGNSFVQAISSLSSNHEVCENYGCDI